MKYLKQFNESFDTQIVISDVKDMLVELEDDGFKVNVSSGKNNQIIVNISKESPGTQDAFKFLDIIEYAERVDDYLSSLGFVVSKDAGTSRSINIVGPNGRCTLTDVSLKFTKKIR